MLATDSGAVFCPNVLFSTKISRVKGKKYVFLMSTMAAVAGHLVKDRQMLPNRDFPTRWKLDNILRAILILSLKIWTVMPRF